MNDLDVLKVEDSDVRKLNREMLKMLIKLEDENSILKEKIRHLEQLLMSVNVIKIGETR